MQAAGCTPCTDSFSVMACLRRCARWGTVALAVALLHGCAPTQDVQGHADAATYTLAHRSDSVEVAPSDALRRFVDPVEDAQDVLQPTLLPEVDQRGLASWYGPRFHGRKTANGERFNQYELTAAHRQYAFNTQLCVRSTANGKTVVVRVNDRGPFVGNRVIDLSKAAAEEIGMLGKGINTVEIYKLEDGQEACHPALQQAQR